MNTSIKIGSIEVHQSEHGLYRLTDLWKASGGAKKDDPNKWRALESTKESIALCLKMSTQNRVLINIHGRGKIQGYYVSKHLAYKYAMWISPEFEYLVIDTFDKLINAPSEQLAELQNQVKQANDTLAFALGELESINSRQPNDKQSLACILGIKAHQARPYFDHLLEMGLLVKSVKTVYKTFYHPTDKAAGVVIGQKAKTLLFDENVKKRFPEQQDWTAQTSQAYVMDGV